MRAQTALLFVGLCIAAAIPSWASDAQIAMALLGQGNFQQARAHIDSAFALDSTDMGNALAYAKLTPDASRAKELYERVADSKTATAAQKAQALYRLGGYDALTGATDGAIAGYEAACGYDPSLDCEHQAAIAAFRDGDLTKAQVTWVMTASATTNEESSHGLYYMGHVYFARKEFEQALNCYRKASKVAGSAWEAPALAGAYLAGVNAGLGRKAEPYLEQLQKRFPFHLESATVLAGPRQLPEFYVHENEGNEVPGKTFKLQVGAYGEKDNASRRRDNLKKDYDNVSIVSAERNDGTVIYRVRVGEFKTRKEAEKFGKKLKRDRIDFQVVQD